MKLSAGRNMPRTRGTLRAVRPACGNPAGTAPICLAAALLSLLAASGCARSTHGQMADFLRAHEETIATGAYEVMPPDAITIHAPVAPEIDGVVRTVRPDGKIALRLLGEVEVAGLTPEQIAARLRTLLSRYYLEPEVVVNVARYASQVYYVFGQVAAPGPKPFSGRDTLLSALAAAQPTFLAWRQQIRVTRPAPELGEPQVIIVDLDRMVRQGDVSRNVLLQPGDIVQVPPTPLAWVGLRVRELLFPLLPIAEAYEAPADMIESTRIYEDEYGHDDDSGAERTGWFGR